MEREKQRFATVDMAYIALMAVLISVCSWVSVPSAVPFTMQTFGVFCALGLLGGRRGSAAVLVFILLGAAGLPVFAGFTGGVGILLGPTGGYILGFLFMALVYWLGERRAGGALKGTAALLLLGLLLCYAFGTAWFMAVYSMNTGPIGLAAALAWCVLPFIVPDLIKLALALLLVRNLSKHLKLQ